MTPNLIVDVACAHLKVPREHLSVRRPNRRTIYARSLVTYLLRDLTSSTYLQIAATLRIAVGDGHCLTTMLIQGSKRVSDGEYPAAAADLRAIRALLTPPAGGRSRPRSTGRTGAGARGSRARRTAA